ncbi:hypothetical protein [Algiphilus sp.]|uniref:hypothetical protein n=1 Tax=Algiphilus sp. TaxID=1872431 RepID=UPI0032EBC556
MADQKDPPQSDDEGNDEGQERHPDKPKQVELDDIKEAHTTHWDMDVMPRAELEKLYAANVRRKRRRVALKVAAVAGGLLALVCATALLALQLD